MADEGLTLSTHPPLPKFYEGRKKRRHRNCVHAVFVTAFRFSSSLFILPSFLFLFFFSLFPISPATIPRIDRPDRVRKQSEISAAGRKIYRSSYIARSCCEFTSVVQWNRKKRGMGKKGFCARCNSACN